MANRKLTNEMYSEVLGISTASHQKKFLPEYGFAHFDCLYVLKQWLDNQEYDKEKDDTMKAYFVYGNYDGNSCNDATVVYATSAEEAREKAKEEGIVPRWVDKASPDEYEVVEYQPAPGITRFVRAVSAWGSTYIPRSGEEL